MANLTWSEEMGNSSSKAFTSLASAMEEELGEVVGEGEHLTVKVVQLLPGSVVVR